MQGGDIINIRYLRYCNYHSKVKSCINPLRLGTVIVLVSSGIDCVNTPRLYSDRATRQFGLMVCARDSPKRLDFTRNTPQLNQLCPR